MSTPLSSVLPTKFELRSKPQAYRSPEGFSRGTKVELSKQWTPTVLSPEMNERISIAQMVTENGVVLAPLEKPSWVSAIFLTGHMCQPAFLLNQP